MKARALITVRNFLLIAAAFVSLAGLYLLSRLNYLLFHSSTEVFSIVVSFAIFAIAWNARRIMDSNYLLFIGIACLFVGGLDLLHTLSYSGMGVFPENSANLPTQLWIAARYMLSLSFLAALFFTNRKFRPNFVIAGYAVVTALLFSSIFYWEIFPTAFTDEAGLTPFKIASEYVISLILLFSIGLLIRKRAEFSGNIVKLMVAAMAVAIAAEMAYTLYTDVYGIANLVGHLFTVVSFYLIYKALIETGLTKPYDLLFRNLKQKEAALTRHSANLTEANNRLEQEIVERKIAEEALRKSEWVARQRAEELEKLQVKLEEKAAEVEEYATRMEELAEERARKLEGAERLAAIGTTAGMVGHDVRNPLQAIVGDLYLLASDVSSLPEGEDKESMKENIASIRKSAEYIDKIVQDLQDYAKPLKPVTGETDLEELCEEVLMKNGFVEDVKVSCEVQEEARKLVTDAGMLKRVLSNLVSNAVQAMPKGGKADVRAFKDAGDLVITVEDTGDGIPEEAKSKVFTPLFTTKSKGQGFGLPVVKRMTEALGGSVRFESEVGKGTKFIVRLPIDRK